MFDHRSGVCGQVRRARFHILCCAVAVHSVSMCSKLSLTSHSAQVCLCSKPARCLHAGPTMYAWCIILYRNCLTRVLRVFFLMLCQIVSSVSSLPQYRLTAFLVFSRFRLVASLSGGVFVPLFRGRPLLVLWCSVSLPGCRTLLGS